jgi:hypothetical protein
MANERPGFADLIEALTIFEKYLDGYAGTHCEHDVLMVCNVDPSKLSRKDFVRVHELGFFVTEVDPEEELYGQHEALYDAVQRKAKDNEWHEMAIQSFRWGS